MRTKLIIAITLFLILAPSAWAGGGHHHDEETEHEETQKGSHGGRILREGDFSLEVVINENDSQPQFRIYPSFDDNKIAPKDVSASIKLTRFGKIVEDFEFHEKDNFLTSSKIVEEPHSFEVTVTAQYKGKSFSWEYDSFEGRTKLSKEALKLANLSFAEAGPVAIHDEVQVYGRIIPNEDKVAHIIPRFPGIVKSIKKSLGESVKKGELLAVVESNQSLQDYEIKSLIDGVVIKRHVTSGEFVSDTQEIFIVADLSEVWADFQIYRDDSASIKSGQAISVELGDGESEIPATISYVSPLADEVTQSKLIRAVIPNANGTLRPGLFVQGILHTAEEPVSLAVRREALQTFRDWNVVYLVEGNVFQAFPVELGRRDSQHVEIKSGIPVGAKYVAENSFIIKADIEKSGAAHDH